MSFPSLTLPPNSTYVITGSTRGIGLEISRSLLSASPTSRVLICALDETEVALTVAMLTTECPEPTTDYGYDRVLGVSCDLSTKDGREALLIGANEAYGDCGLTGLINNVSCNVQSCVLNQSEDDYYDMFRTNVDSSYFLCKSLSTLLFKCSLSPSLHGHGSVVINVSSIGGMGSIGTGACFEMCKAAVLALTKALACEWSRYNVRVNAVAPFITYSAERKGGEEGGELKEKATEKLKEKAMQKVKNWTPLGRLATASEVAGPVLFLCLPGLSSFVQGTCINVDGGVGCQAFEGPCIDEE